MNMDTTANEERPINPILEANSIEESSTKKNSNDDKPFVRIGNAASTVVGDKAALKWASTWLNENEGVESIAKLTEIHVEGKQYAMNTPIDAE